ncbi:MAG: 4Fe-4S binding protein [Candidatus Methylomirabilia bacterium]
MTPKHGAAILLCGELESLGNDLDVRAVESWLGERFPEARVVRAPGPCENPESFLNSCPIGSGRLILGLCRSVDKPELHRHLRKRGRDPFEVEVVALGGYGPQVPPRQEGTEKAKALLGGAMARSRAYSGSHPENIKPILSWDQRVSRRSLFTLPPLFYEAVPSISAEACAAKEGCRVCVVACPREAIGPADGRGLTLDKSLCTGCGACVSACPRTAIDLPGASPSQLDAQLAALLGGAPAAPSPRGIVFVCERGVSTLEALAQKGLPYPAGWFPVEVPCIGMVTPAWLLHSLNLGACAVAVLPCSREECRFGRPDVVRGRVDCTRELLSMLGASPERVRLLDPSDAPTLARELASLPEPLSSHAGARSNGASLFTPRAATRALLDLADAYGAGRDRSLTHPHSPFGVVEVTEGCTACGACVQACPTGSLALERDREGLALTFEAGLCIGCGECVPVCPESVVRVEQVTDLLRLSRGKHALYRDSEARCEKCGGPVAPRAMLDRIGALLGNNPAISTITQYCLPCRGALR